jgi:ribosomal protein L3
MCPLVAACTLAASDRTRAEVAAPGLSVQKGKVVMIRGAVPGPQGKAIAPRAVSMSAVWEKTARFSSGA